MKTLDELNNERSSTVEKNYWSRTPGEFLAGTTGEVINENPPEYVALNEWYETLLLVVNRIVTKYKQNSGDFDGNFSLYVSPDVKTIMEYCVSWKDIFQAETQSDVEEKNYSLSGTVYGFNVFCMTSHPNRIIDIVCETVNKTIGVIEVKF